jgi:lipopolysaccharide/colanic/teichoic acid biosynthesis glycosyltransferase
MQFWSIHRLAGSTSTDRRGVAVVEAGLADASAGEEDVRERIRNLVASRWIAQFVIVDPGPDPILRQFVRAGRLTGRSVRVLARLNREDLPPPLSGERWVESTLPDRPGWVLTSPHPPAWKRAIKRTTDLLIAGLLLVILSPLMTVIALVIRSSSPGPILYRWRVVGKNGKAFTGYKFRTMVRDADRMKEDLIDQNEMDGPVFKLINDPRITWLGRSLRKYSLDELPQLWSILTGDMSLVGPRPALPEEYRRYQLWQMRRLSVTPGLTCLWQVQGRNAIRSFGDWARLDLRYIDHWSLGLDAKILLQTVLVVLRGTGR